MSKYKKDRYYLGPSSWSQRLLRLLPFGKYFNKYAWRHDNDFGKGGGWKEFFSANNRFWLGMFKKCLKNPFKYFFLNWFFALLYFLLVSTFGIFFFNWGGD